MASRQATFTALTATNDQQRTKENLSATIEKDGAMYRYVRNKDVVALSLGNAAFHRLSDGADLLKNVYMCLTADLSVMAGIVVATDGLAANSGTNPKTDGWIQIFGTNASISVVGDGATAIAVGEYLKGVTATVNITRDTAALTSYKRRVQALATQASTAAAAYLLGFIDCR